MERMTTIMMVTTTMATIAERRTFGLCDSAEECATGFAIPYQCEGQQCCGRPCLAKHPPLPFLLFRLLWHTSAHSVGLCGRRTVPDQDHNPRRYSNNNLKPMKDIPPARLAMRLSALSPRRPAEQDKARSRQTREAADGRKQLGVPSPFNGCDTVGQHAPRQMICKRTPQAFQIPRVRQLVIE